MVAFRERAGPSAPNAVYAIRFASKLTRPDLLCATSVFSVSLWLVFGKDLYHRDTENTEAAQRQQFATDF